MDSINDALAAILRTVQTPGDFFATGECALRIAALARLVRGGGPGDTGSHTANVSWLREFRDSAVQRYFADRRRWSRSSRLLREVPHE